MTIQAVLLDLDGVIVSTDEYHYQGWQRLADEEGIPFDREINERLRGVSRMASLQIVLEKATRTYAQAEQEAMATRKNGYYLELLDTKLTPDQILPGVHAFLAYLAEHGLRTAVASSSRNSPTILKKIGMAEAFDATVDGNNITNSKPDPEVFLKAAERLHVPAEACLVVEDAEAGVSAGLAAGMKVLAVGSAASDARAHQRAMDLAALMDRLRRQSLDALFTCPSD